MLFNLNVSNMDCRNDETQLYEKTKIFKEEVEINYNTN